MSQAEISTITAYLNKDQTMLEYGCGGSTNFFSKYVKEYYSIEHDKVWFDRINSDRNSNVTIYHVARNNVTPETERIIPYDIDGLDQSSRQKDFHDYITFPNRINKTFDAVLIDGRARPECAKYVKQYLKKNAYVFVHDYWERERYHMIASIYELVDSVKTGQSLAVFRA